VLVRSKGGHLVFFKVHNNFQKALKGQCNEILYCRFFS
jgi:hypothetical protein